MVSNPKRLAALVMQSASLLLVFYPAWFDISCSEYRLEVVEMGSNSDLIYPKFDASLNRQIP
jgi:hypothetical protein